jgi:uncharacterized protein (TIGR00297 family)
VTQPNLRWQSKLVLLAVLPFAGTWALLACFAWPAPVVLCTIGLSLLLGLVTWRLRAATPAAAVTGAAIVASLQFSTIIMPIAPWRTALVPALAVSLLAYAATRVGRRQKEQIGTAERRQGRSAAQIAANLGLAAFAASGPVQLWLIDRPWLPRLAASTGLWLSLSLAAMAEAAADTVSSEIGQVLGGRPRLLTTLRPVEPGRDGAVSLAGSLAGILAAAAVAACGTWALGGGGNLFWISYAGGVFGLFFDSLLGATLEERGWLNNDAVNFLSTAAAAGFALAVLAALR